MSWRFWRIAKTKYATARSCAGNKRVGGRWNHPASGLLYTATTIALAALEKFVHIAGLIPTHLVLVAVDMPGENALVKPVQVSALATGWDARPAAGPSQDFGARWFSVDAYWG